MAVQLLTIDQDILDSARLTADQAKIELAVYLYSQRRLSLGRAANWRVCRCGHFASCWHRVRFRPITMKLTCWPM